MTNGQILHGSHNGYELLYYKGDIRHTLCVALDQYLQQLLEKPDLHGFVCDLTEVYGIDSTNLGILARLARAMQKAGLPKVTLISSQEDIDELLEAVGFDEVFNIVHTAGTDDPPLDEIAQVANGNDQAARLMLEAHRALMELNPDNRDRFKDVVKAFEQEIKA